MRNMDVRYLLVFSDSEGISEGIHCIGPLPRIGEQIVVRKQYGERARLLCQVVNVRYIMDVVDVPLDERGARGSSSRDDIPEVYVAVERSLST